LTEHPQVTAIFSCNDQIAADLVAVADSFGRRVPDDLSIVGFDDIDVASRMTPHLTTMHVDRSLMGALAVRRLYDRATTLNCVPVKTVVGTRLVVRQSVYSLTDGPLPANGKQDRA
jgi:LacI family transcriptional regulator